MNIFKHRKELCGEYTPTNHLDSVSNIVVHLFFTYQSTYLFFFFYFFVFLELYLWHMEVPRLGNRIRAVAASLCHSSRQCWFLNPLSKARDRTRVLMDTSWVCYPLSHDGNSSVSILLSIHPLHCKQW